jgi:YggT family protein
MIDAFRILLIQVLDLYFYVIIAAVVASWLVGFGIVNSYNPVARAILRVLHALTEPLFRPFRKIIPPIGGLDLSPLIALLLLNFLRNWLAIGRIF